MSNKLDLVKVRRAVADYISSEGCSCCRGSKHDEHKAELAKLLRVPKYDDDSGFNFGHFESRAGERTHE